MIGRRYHLVYGYPWRWAVLAEIAWRLEHVRYDKRTRSDDGARLSRWIGGRAYVWRKRLERKGAGA